MIDGDVKNATAFANGKNHERDDYLELKLREFRGNTWREINLELP